MYSTCCHNEGNQWWGVGVFCVGQQNVLSDAINIQGRSVSFAEERASSRPREFVLLSRTWQVRTTKDARRSLLKFGIEKRPDRPTIDLLTKPGSVKRLHSRWSCRILSQSETESSRRL